MERAVTNRRNTSESNAASCMTQLDLDSACGRLFTYRDLIECSKTWRMNAAREVHIDNWPRRIETFAALEALCTRVLEPLSVMYGRPTITYGFASRALTSRIRVGIAPRLDQHASFEVGANGSPVCARGGA